MHSTWPTLQFDYSGYHVLVTGGSNGIGEGIARAYAAAGAAVTITGTRPAAADYDKDLSGFTYLPLQVTDNDNIQAVADALPRLDILINNAGASLLADDEFKPDTFEKSVQINLFSAYRMACACKPKLAASALPGGASVIGIASLTSFFGTDYVPGYGAAKAGLVQLTKSMGMVWAADNIRANAVAAGLVASNMTAAMLQVEPMTAPFIARTPLKRVGQPHDIAGAVLFLTSAAAAYITGQTLIVDGGFSISG